MSSFRVLVTDGETRAGVAAVRGLVEAGFAPAGRRSSGATGTPAARRSSEPAGGSGWLRGRLRDVPINGGVTVIEARADGDRVTLRCSDGSTRAVDHVLLGTGYRVDVRRYPFPAPLLAAEIDVAAGGYPVLGAGLESTVPGMYFMGAAAAHSFRSVRLHGHMGVRHDAELRPRGRDVEQLRRSAPMVDGRWRLERHAAGIRAGGGCGHGVV